MKLDCLHIFGIELGAKQAFLVVTIQLGCLEL